MKYKTTAKAVRNGYCNLVSVGYCSLCNLLHYVEPAAYTCGVYGWNADIYSYGNNAIVTGYRPFGNIHPDHTIIRKYEEMAQAINANYSTPYQERKTRVNALLDEFMKEVC